MSWFLLKTISPWLPKNGFGDYAYELALFRKVHARFPNGGNGYNDRLFQIRTSKSFYSPLRAFISDKEWVKVFVDGVVGPGFCVPTLKVLRSMDEVRGYTFPDRCCIKPTHMSGEVLFRRMGETIDQTKIAGWFRTSYYESGREANYRGLPPKVIVEPLIFDGKEVNDYKIFCFGGQPRLVQVDVHRFTAHRRTIYDTEWVQQSFRYGEPEMGPTVPRPQNFPEMLRAAASIAAHFDFIRVDCYSDGFTFMIGELTNCPCNCTSKFYPPEAELTMGEIVFGQRRRPT
jgi:hypothetical protein